MRALASGRQARLPIVLTLALAILFCCSAGRAAAQYTPASLVSDSGSLEADDAYGPAISANGEYVAFVGSFDGVHGVYRKDLTTGELALVAGEESGEPSLSAPDAGSPSISAEGRYVSFTTTARLDPADDQAGDPGRCSSVYVRDMDVAAGQSGAYTLASALNDTTQGITYAGSASSGCPGGGSAAADRVAISADGEKVAFTVLGQSNLTTGVGGATTTPADQIAVRNIRTHATTLVSQTISSLGGTPEAVPGGAALASLTDRITASDGRQISGSTAAISANGSTVAWMGIDIAAQALATAPEDALPNYDEPLWRRIGEGPDAPTRRVTGGDDPECGCAGPLDTAFDPDASLNATAGPQYGVYVAPGGFGGDPLAGGLSLDSVTPQLSADGEVVAFLSTQPRTGQVGQALEQELNTSTANAYVVNMASGLTRSAALTQLTAWGTDNFKDAASTGAITEIALSPSGTEVAFTTSRIDFPLTPPALLTPSLSQPPSPQLYVANLSAGSLELASYGFEGEPANGTIATPSFTGSGETLAFASSASNLVYGAYDEGVQGIPGNVFVLSQVSTPIVAAQSLVTPAPPAPVAPESWELLLDARSSANGSIELYATVPRAGRLQVTARAAVPVAQTATRRHGRRARSRSAAKRGSATKGKAATTSPTRNADAKVLERKVTSAAASARQAGLLQLRLKLPAADRALARRAGGLYATIAVTFSAQGRPSLKGTVQASFELAASKRKQKDSKR